MPKIKSNALVYLCFCYSIFSFATTILDKTIYTKEWIVYIIINSALTLIVSILLINIKEYNFFQDLILVSFIIFSITKHIKNFSEYINITHNDYSLFNILFLSGIVIIYLFSFHSESLRRISPIVFNMIIFMLIITFALNINKIVAVNIYTQPQNYYLSLRYIQVFDWVIPLCILYDEKKEDKKKIFTFIIINALALITISILTGLILRGDILYSLSPLHSLFTISKGVIIQRYDYLFTVFLIIAFFCVLLLNIGSVNKIRNRQEKIKLILFVKMIPLVLLFEYIHIFIVNFMIIFVVIAVLILNRMEKTNEKV